MVSSIDETELARLEALSCAAGAGEYSAHDEADDSAKYAAAACNAVPALVAEVRRLQAQYSLSESMLKVTLRGAEQTIDGLKHRNTALRENVEAWEWYNECRIYDPWREHPYWTACGRSSHLRKDQNSIGTRRARALENAIAEWHAIVEAAREAVHADRE